MFLFADPASFSVFLIYFSCSSLQILQSLPGVGQLSGKDGTSLLVTLIGQAAGWDLSRSEEQNLLSFVRHLFQVCTIETLYAFDVDVQVSIPYQGYS